MWQAGSFSSYVLASVGEQSCQVPDDERYARCRRYAVWSDGTADASCSSQQQLTSSRDRRLVIVIYWRQMSLLFQVLLWYCWRLYVWAAVVSRTDSAGSGSELLMMQVSFDLLFQLRQFVDFCCFATTNDSHLSCLASIFGIRQFISLLHIAPHGFPTAIVAAPDILLLLFLSAQPLCITCTAAISAYASRTITGG
jgi:hypothetical protein